MDIGINIGIAREDFAREDFAREDFACEDQRRDTGALQACRDTLAPFRELGDTGAEAKAFDILGVAAKAL